MKKKARDQGHLIWNNLNTTFSKTRTISGSLKIGNCIIYFFELVHVKQTIMIARTFLCSCNCYRTKVNAVDLLAVHKENHDVFKYFIFSFVLDITLKMFSNIGICQPFEVRKESDH